MIVECIENTGINLPSVLLSHDGWHRDMEFEELTIGKTYVVYSILHVDDVPFYLICSDIYDGRYINYPSLLPFNLFGIRDNTSSEFWQAKKDSKDVGFREILLEEFFYGHLVEGYKREVQIFLNNKKRIDQDKLEHHAETI